MARLRRTILPLDAGTTGTRTEAEVSLSLVPPKPDVDAEPEPPAASPQRTPERQKLADTLATIAALEVEITDTSAALSQAETSLYASISAFDDAEKVLARSKPRQETYGVVPKPRGAFWGGQLDYEAAVAEAALPPIPIADAKAAVEAVKDAKDSARALVQHHKDRLDRLQSSLRMKRLFIGDAVREVVRSDPALMALAEASRRLATRAAATRMAFEAATSNDTIQPGSPFYGCTRPVDARTSPEAMADWSVSRAWSEALEALQSDPDAPLPMPGHEIRAVA